MYCPAPAVTPRGSSPALEKAAQAFAWAAVIWLSKKRCLHTGDRLCQLRPEAQ
jgi:hypothetical protein